MVFTPFDKQAAIITAPYFATQRDRFCDWTVGLTYLWRDYFCCRYAIAADCLMLEVQYDGATYYTCPLGHGDWDAAYRLLEAHCRQTGQALRFATVSAVDTEALRRRYSDITVLPQRDFYDYLYRYTDLATFAGRRYSAQRNHINQFEKRWPEWQYRPLTRREVPAVKAFLHDLNQRKAETEAFSAIETAEETGCYDLLDAMHDFADAGVRLTGGILTVDGQIVAFSIGERVGDTLYVHVEKGDTRYHGVYQLIVREYAAHNGADGILYINREDDAGDEGLRRSKLSYRPCALLEKNIVTIG